MSGFTYSHNYVTPESAATRATEYVRRTTVSQGHNAMHRKSTPGWVRALLVVILLASAGVVIGVLVTNHTSSPPTMTTSAPATTATSAPATAAQSTPAPAIIDLDPLCNVVFTNGTCRAIVSYHNYGADMTLTGAQNTLSTGTPPTTFAAGYHFGGASFLWDCSAAQITTWHVQATPHTAPSIAVISQSPIACPALPL